MLNFTLRDKGLIEYDWDQAWTRAIPDQARDSRLGKENESFSQRESRAIFLFMGGCCDPGR